MQCFPSSNRIIKPLASQHEEGSKSRIRNHRFPGARRVVENAFGIMVSVFRVLRKTFFQEGIFNSEQYGNIV